MSYEAFAKTVSHIEQQNAWRSSCINLIASENITSEAVRRYAGSDFTHRYAEGHPGQRYYCGTTHIDKIETDVRELIKKIFSVSQADVRPISGTNANEAVFSKMISYDDIVMVNSTPGGGHISHHRMGAIGKFTRNIIDFPITPDGYHIDVDASKDLISRIKPRMVVFGKSLFLFPDPVQELADVCREVKATVIFDAAHVLGLIAGGCFQNPLVEGAHIMTGSTHKTFFGPQRGIIVSNTDDEKLWRKIDRGVFPGSSSNHHLGTLAQLALSACEMIDFGRAYAAQIIKNARALASALDRQGFDVVAKQFGYTQSHQVAVNVKRFGGGAPISTLLEENNIIVNMNMLPHEPLKNHLNPEGLRIGVPEMTRMGMRESEMERIAELMQACIIGKKQVRDEVSAFRADFQAVKYSYDDR
jgi:glycine hydroxymethyltransferase